MLRRLEGPLIFSVVAISSVAAADEPSNTEEHRALMISAQVTQKEGHLLRSRELLTSCANKPCTDVGELECEGIRAFCEKRLAPVSSDIPTVALRVEDDRGLPVHAELFEVDSVGVDATKPMPLDPGAHLAKALYAGRRGETEFVLAPGRKGAEVVVRIDLREVVHRRPVPLPVYALGATAIVAGVLALGTGISTAHSYQSLDSCRPYCDSGQRSSLRTTGYVADVSAVVTLASAIAGTIWFFARPTVAEKRWLRATTTAEETSR